MISNHNRFVRDVAYSPDGDLFASVASDGKLFFYDGKTGELKSEAERSESSSLVGFFFLDRDAALVLINRWRAPGIPIRQRSRQPLRTVW